MRSPILKADGIMRNGILAVVVLGLAPTLASAQGWAEKMFKDGMTHDFGTRPKGAQLKQEFTITNIYAVRMEITGITSGCGCVTASAPKRTLEPRESTTITVHMDTRRFSGPKTVGVRVSVGPEFVSSAELKVVANSRPDVVLNPGEINLGSVTVGQTPKRTLDIEYAGSLEWQVAEVVARDVPFTVTVRELYRRTGQVGYQLEATLKPDASVGAHDHDVFLKTNDPASPVLPIRISAHVQSAVTVSPAQLSLGSIKADMPQTRRVVVRASKPFQILGVEGLGNGVELGVALVPADAPVQTLTLTIHPAAGEFKRELKIKTSAQEAPVVLPVDANVVR
jgi:hypothetical protein